jgi:hypothetical protein
VRDSRAQQFMSLWQIFCVNGQPFFPSAHLYIISTRTHLRPLSDQSACLRESLEDGQLKHKDDFYMPIAVQLPSSGQHHMDAVHRVLYRGFMQAYQSRKSTQSLDKSGSTNLPQGETLGRADTPKLSGASRSSHLQQVSYGTLALKNDTYLTSS